MKINKLTTVNKNNEEEIKKIPSINFKGVANQYFKNNEEYVLISNLLLIDTDYFVKSFSFIDLNENTIPFIKIIPKIRHLNSAQNLSDNVSNDFYYTWNKISNKEICLNCKIRAYERIDGNIEQCYFALSIFIPNYIQIESVFQQ